jgi:transcriptional antiterminator NusG
MTIGELKHDDIIKAALAKAKERKAQGAKAAPAQSEAESKNWAVRVLQERAKLEGLEASFGEVLVPTEDVVERVGGSTRKSKRKFFPGYVLVKMDMTNDSWHLVRNTPKVTGFLGAKDKPQPISEREAERLINQVKEGIEKPKPAILFEVGEQVRVSDGPFTSFNGVVEEIDEEKSRLKVSVSIFGRPTPVELEYTQVEKV